MYALEVRLWKKCKKAETNLDFYPYIRSKGGHFLKKICIYVLRGENCDGVGHFSKSRRIYPAGTKK